MEPFEFVKNENFAHSTEHLFETKTLGKWKKANFILKFSAESVMQNSISGR